MGLGPGPFGVWLFNKSSLNVSFFFGDSSLYGSLVSRANDLATGFNRRANLNNKQSMTLSTALPHWQAPARRSILNAGQCLIEREGLAIDTIGKVPQ